MNTEVPRLATLGPTFYHYGKSNISRALVEYAIRHHQANILISSFRGTTYDISDALRYRYNHTDGRNHYFGYRALELPGATNQWKEEPHKRTRKPACPPSNLICQLVKRL